LHPVHAGLISRFIIGRESEPYHNAPAMIDVSNQAFIKETVRMMCSGRPACGIDVRDLTLSGD
jgi:hypothetical protein